MKFKLLLTDVRFMDFFFFLSKVNKIFLVSCQSQASHFNGLFTSEVDLLIQSTFNDLAGPVVRSTKMSKT